MISFGNGRVKRWALALGGMIFCHSLTATGEGVIPLEFAAKVVRTHSKEPEKNSVGHMYVGSQAIRTEGTRGRQPVMLIYHKAKNEAWMVLPDEKTYMRFPETQVARPPLPDDPQSPCQTVKELRCRVQGTTSLRGRATTIWEISLQKNNQWLLYGRLWTDSRLGVAIREEYSDGMTLELVDIQEGVQAPSLFEIPVGFKETVIPSPPEKAASGGNSP
ncbi:MAG: hypothetical protein HQL56_13560 [Magnetococcales bacterium]|nr:hypothetical protein [Magnetococcales bacterium]